MRVAFVHVPKAAGGSITWWLREGKKESKFDHSEGHYLLSEIKEKYGDFDFSFAVTRNTYNRMISAYVWSIEKINKKLRKSIQRNNTKEYESWKSKHDAWNRGIVYFVEYAQEHMPVMARPLKEWLNGVDIVLNQENLNEEFKDIQNKLKFYLPLSTEGHKLNYNARDYYSDEYVKIIKKYYQEELDTFGYLPKF